MLKIKKDQQYIMNTKIGCEQATVLNTTEYSREPKIETSKRGKQALEIVVFKGRVKTIRTKLRDLHTCQCTKEDGRNHSALRTSKPFLRAETVLKPTHLD